jgi:hypothetical protein
MRLHYEKKLEKVRLVIPDAGILITLAHGDMLNILLEFADDVHILTTDLVEFEVTRRADLFDAKKITEFFANNKGRIHIESTGYEDIIQTAKANPDMKLPPDIGETSIYGYVNNIRRELPGITTLVLFEDNFFVTNELGARPTMVHLVSMASFLTYAEQVIPNFLYHYGSRKKTMLDRKIAS